jgi:hypothetical protein
VGPALHRQPDAGGGHRAGLADQAVPKSEKRKGITRLTLNIPVGLDIRIGAIAKPRDLK